MKIMKTFEELIARAKNIHNVDFSKKQKKKTLAYILSSNNLKSFIKVPYISHITTSVQTSSNVCLPLLSGLLE